LATLYNRLLLLLRLQGVGNWKTYEGSWVQSLNAAGFSVAGIDNRGCGRSSGLLGYVVRPVAVTAAAA
jgi:alpha-beta hydrolase superfamily lysophospholipase